MLKIELTRKWASVYKTLADGSVDNATCGGAQSSCTAALSNHFCDKNFGNTEVGRGEG